MSGEVSVDPDELDAKAAQIAEPMPKPPGESLPPCALQVAASAVVELNKNASHLRGYSASGDAEATRLAESFRSAADAYRQVDQQAGIALDNGDSAPEITPVTPAPPTTPPVPVPPSPGYQCHAAPLVMLEDAAAQIEAPDQAASLEVFRDEWNAYAAALDTRADAFSSSGMSWDGGAADAAYASLDRHREWLREMATASRTLAGQGDRLAAVHRGSRSEHPTLAQVTSLDQQIIETTDVRQRMALMEARMKLQNISEEVLGRYAGQSAFPPVEPPQPPTTGQLPPVDKPTKDPKNHSKPLKDPAGEDMQKQPTAAGGGGAGSGDAPGSEEPAGMPTAPAAQQKTPSGAGQSSSGGAPSGGGSPSGGGAGGGMPSLPEFGGPSTDVPSPGDPSLKPAAASGGGAGAGGGGSGGGGAGPMPLQPNVGGVSVGPTPGSAGAGPGATAGSGGAAMGGGMGGGMAPMHGAGQNQGGKEKKRTPDLSPDEDLYNEDRPWTEAVIGNRSRRRDTSEDKDTK